MDSVNKKKRSEIMSKVRSQGNRSTELRLKESLIHAGILGWDVNATDIVGKPDFVFRREKVAIFVDGCFWHGCPKHLRRPNSNTAYWQSKIDNNVKRDQQRRSALRRQGWSVIRVWEHDLSDPTSVLRRISKALQRRSVRSHKGM